GPRPRARRRGGDLDDHRHRGYRLLDRRPTPRPDAARSPGRPVPLDGTRRRPPAAPLAQPAPHRPKHTADTPARLLRCLSFYRSLVAMGNGVLKGELLVGGFIAIKPENEIDKHLQLLA